MNTEIKTVEKLLSALGIDLPVEFLARLDIGQYLDQLDHIAALAPGERQRLGELLHAAQRINSSQLEEALAKQRQDGRQLGEILIGQGLVTQREADLLLEFQQRGVSKTSASGKFALGNILVASDQITRAQLENALMRQVDTGRRLGEELIEAGHASKGQVEGGLLLQKKLIAYALAITVGLASLAAPVPSAEAVQRNAVLAVSATVVANAKMHTSYQATQLQISADDVVRGYVEVPAALRFSVATTSRSGYLMEFHPVGKVFESVQVNGLGNAVQLGADGGTIVQRGPLPPNLTHDLSFHFTLRPDTPPGNYPWPLLLHLRAL